MSQQKLILRLGIISILLGSFLAFPLKANAGKDVIPGTTSDSSGTAGNNFEPEVVTTTLTTTVNGVTVSPDSKPGSVILIVTQTIQTALNNFATNLLSETNVSTVRSEVRELFARRGRNVITVTEKIKRNWISYGVKETRIEVLLIKLSQCITVIGTSQSGDPVTVDVSNLSAAIDEYNQIVKESNGITLQKLSQDETFMEIGKILKEFRATLNTSI